jgi:hypothetical protein
LENDITIIEGPPPTFEAVADGWVTGLSDSPILSALAMTKLRTFNGPALVERCHRAWRSSQSIHLVYRSSEGLEQKAPIIAARNVLLPEGDMLVLWLRLKDLDVEIEFGDGDDDIEDDADGNPPGLP